ncbi:hypothetical protein LIR42_14640, partial [Faecalicatena fissicatena]
NFLGCLSNLLDILNLFSICSFQGTYLTDILSAIRTEKNFSTLITGKTSYGNSTSLLIGLTNPSSQLK